jgi:hypothetical protein
MIKLLIASSCSFLLLTGLYTHPQQLTSMASVENSNHKIPELFIPKGGEPTEHHVKFKLNARTEHLPNMLPVYKFVKNNSTPNDVIRAAQKLNFSGEVKENPVLNTLFIRDGHKFLEIEQESGILTYLNEAHLDQPTVNGRPKVILSDEEAVTTATKFLTTLSWLPANFKVVGVTENRMIPGNLNPETDKGVVSSKSVHFHKFVDGKPVLGVSRIIVDVGDNGEIEAVRKYHKDQVQDHILPTKTVAAAIAELEAGNGMHNIEPGGEEAIIEEISTSYWEDAGSPSEQPYLQPVYMMKGTYTKNGKQLPFSAYIPAISHDFVLAKKNQQTNEPIHPDKLGR